MKNYLKKKLASKIISSMAMKPDETLLLKSGTHNQELSEEVALEAMKIGVKVLLSTSSDDFSKRVYEEVPLKYLKKTSKLSLKMADVIDNMIHIESTKDPRVLENIGHNALSAATEAGVPINKKLDDRMVKWCFVGYPTEELAEQLGVEFAKLEKFIFDGMLVDHKKIIEKGNIIRKKLIGADSVSITDEYGTDLKLKMGKRKIMISDGFISENDLKHKDVGLNLPDGEVFTTPLETYGEGILVSPKRRDYFTEKMIEDIELVFEKGKLNMKKTKAGKNEKMLKNSIKRCTAIDRKNYKTVRTTNVAELGIGLNNKINDIIGYLLTDEKVCKTIHVAIGKNKNSAYGGKSDSTLHWDFITNQGVNLDVHKNGRTYNVLEKGKIVE